MQLSWSSFSEDVRRRNPGLKAVLSKKTKREKKPVLTTAQWDAKIFPGGVWMQVPEIPPSLNDWKGWHHMKQHKYKQYLYDQVEKLVVAFKIPRLKYAVVNITYFFPSRQRRDIIDNYAPKFLMDALVNGGVLLDDRSDWVEVPRPVAKYDREGSRVEIEIINNKHVLGNIVS